MKRVALITGGTRGIGWGIAQALAKEGCDLALCGRRPKEEVAAQLASLQSNGSRIHYFVADVAKSEDRQRLLEAIQSELGGLHILVNNAGVAPRIRADILEASEEIFTEVLQTNLQGPYFLTQQAARWMIQQQAESPDQSFVIINISSVSAETASTSRGEYCISKAGIGMATKLWAVRLAVYGIPVYEIRPGVIRTDMTAAVEEKYNKLFASGLAPQARWGTIDDVGKAAAALVRGDFPYSTGQVILVDGGMSILRL